MDPERPEPVSLPPSVRRQPIHWEPPEKPEPLPSDMFRTMVDALATALVAEVQSPQEPVASAVVPLYNGAAPQYVQEGRHGASTPTPPPAHSPEPKVAPTQRQGGR